MTPARSDSSRKYDDRRLTPFSFLMEIMHDPSVPLELRIDAASKLIFAGPGYVRDPDITVRLPDHGQLQ